VLLLTAPSQAFDLVVPVLVWLASLLLAVEPRLTRRLSRGREGTSGRSRPADGRRVHRLHLRRLLGGALGVVLVGALGLGLGELHLANALKTVPSLVTGTVAAVVFGLFGPASWTHLRVCAPASLHGGVAGARVATRLPATPLRAFIVAFGVAVLAFLFLRG
jgi:uncharacterized membrane protein YfcA